MHFTEVITAIGALTLIFISWRQGANKASSEVIATYREQVNQLREEVKDLTAKLGELYGMLKEKNSRIKTLEDVLTNKNPEMEAYMKSSLATLNNIESLLITTQSERRKASKVILKSIKN